MDSTPPSPPHDRRGCTSERLTYVPTPVDITPTKPVDSASCGDCLTHLTPPRHDPYLESGYRYAQYRNCNQTLYLRYAPIQAQTDDGAILQTVLPAQLQSLQTAIAEQLNIHMTPDVLSELTVRPVGTPTTSQWEFRATLEGGQIATARPAQAASGMRYQPATATSPTQSLTTVSDPHPTPTPRRALRVALNQLLTENDTLQ